MTKQELDAAFDLFMSDNPANYELFKMMPYEEGDREYLVDRLVDHLSGLKPSEFASLDSFGYSEIIFFV